ncbi:MAG: ATP-binding cassette domain-containing protein [Mesorhizobium sp.]|nr:MAG: ABC transporter ATP-binding protein [Mesorhizobium sp.]RWL27808.1 MAG: ABC transporter ATP-binding protein [Mesorhizobium sp.]RWL29117.1 MAG: ABC transporter ATP-binding protein [Mesorhizobium sp.]RWL37291.1 MAG: ABC transporter ATP-binding protein [Mesorhizobium sp.]RWL55626.1 MAG: ABC transporter ATP-binding protein [Mesorhizobium sp.]
MMSGGLINIVDLKTHFRDRRTGAEVKACDGVTVSIGEGEIVGLVGESGCGKSTLGRTIVGLERPTSGKIIFRGEDLLSLRGRRLAESRRQIQYIFQDPYSSLSTRQTIGQAIDEALVINGEKNAKARRKRTEELLAAVGLPTQIMDRYSREMSGGQRQRVCIARALAANPKVLICDEPVSSLDVSIRAQIMNLFLQLRDEMGMACLLIAHDLAVVRQAAQRVYVMYLGRLMEIGESGALYGTPSHPYTQALLSAIPDTDPRQERARQRVLLNGDVPSPVNPPTGCRFRTRCPTAQAICETSPPAKVMGPDHIAACHFAGEVNLAPTQH